MLRPSLVLVLLAALALPASAGAADPAPPTIKRSLTPADPEFRVTQSGWTVWSAEISNRWWMLARRSGTTRLLPVPPSRVTHDPGIGKGPDSRLTTVFQRCTGNTCSLWSLRLAGGTPRRLKGLGTVRRSGGTVDGESYETHPTIWGANVAFQTRSAGSWVIKIGPSSGPGAARRLRTGTYAGTEALDLALGPKQLGIAYYASTCPQAFFECTVVQLTGLSSQRTKRLDSGSGGEGCSYEPDDLQFDGRAFTWTAEAGAHESYGGDCPSFSRKLRHDPTTQKTRTVSERSNDDE